MAGGIYLRSTEKETSDESFHTAVYLLFYDMLQCFWRFGSHLGSEISKALRILQPSEDCVSFQFSDHFNPPTSWRSTQFWTYCNWYLGGELARWQLFLLFALHNHINLSPEHLFDVISIPSL